MVVSYTDFFMTRVLPGLERLLEAEFTTTLKIYVSDMYEDFGTESLRLEPNTSPLAAELSVGESRIYTVLGSYYTKLDPGRERMQEITRRLARINRIVITNRHYISSSVYQWHDAQLNDFGRRAVDIALNEPDSVGVGFFEFQCTVTEGIS